MNRRSRRMLQWAERIFWFVAVLSLGIYALAYAERTGFQKYEQWSFQRALARGPKQAPRASARLRPGALIGRIAIPRLGLDEMVVESTTDECLRRAVGHIEGTALPAATGNVGLAGHRDTFFRALRRIRPHDVIEIGTLEGAFRYSVESTSVVDPDDTEALAASTEPTLTLVTCYPFHYIGTAPRRCIVRARRISGPPVAGELVRPRPTRGS